MQLQESAIEVQEMNAALSHDVKVADSGRMVLLRVLGPLDMATAPSFSAALRARMAPGCVVVVDLRRADFIDSAGVRGLLCLNEQARANNGEVRLVIASGSRVERTLGLLRLIGHFPVFRSTDEAWNSRPSPVPRLPL